MKVIFKRVLEPLYEFEKNATETWEISYPSTLVIIKDSLWEVNDVHKHTWLICKTSQLIKIIA